MHKALMLLLCGEVVLWGYLDNKIHDLNMTKNRVEKYHDSIAVLKSTFATISFASISPNNFLHKNNWEELLKSAAMRCSITNLDSQQDGELTFCASSERSILKFLHVLKTESNMLLIINEIKIIRQDDCSLKAKVNYQWCHVNMPLSICAVKPVIIPRTDLFGLKKNKHLTAILHNKQACINNKWYKVGDIIDDDDIITHIRENNISLSVDGIEKTVLLGGFW